MARGEATVFVDLPDADAWRVRLVARASSTSVVAPTDIGLRVNGAFLPFFPVTADWHTYEWSVTTPLLRPVNEVTIVTRPTRGPAPASFAGMTVGSISFSPRRPQ
jgi:hypothetical protein